MAVLSPRHRAGVLLGGVLLLVWYIVSVDSDSTASYKRWLPLSSPSTAWSEGSPYVRRVKLTHPIPNLMEEAETKYRNMLSRQSTSLTQSVAEYQRRYGRPPPKGFDQWWDFAMDNDFVMIDEFDSLMGDLEPFWQLPPEEIRRRTSQVRPEQCIRPPRNAVPCQLNHLRHRLLLCLVSIPFKSTKAMQLPQRKPRIKPPASGRSISS